MTTQSIEKEILGLEKQYWQAIKDKNIDAALRLTDDPCIIAGAQGIERVSKDEFVNIMKNATYTLHDFKLKDDAEVRLLNDDVAILAYQVHEELAVDGQPVSIDAAESSTWVRRNGHWVCAMHTESLAGDPYGRDKAH